MTTAAERQKRLRACQRASGPPCKSGRPRLALTDAADQPETPAERKRRLGRERSRRWRLNRRSGGTPWVMPADIVDELPGDSARERIEAAARILRQHLARAIKL